MAFMLVTDPELAPAFLGAILAGAVPAIFPPITTKQDPDLFWNAHRELFSRLAVALVVTDADNAPAASARLPELAIRIIEVGLITGGNLLDTAPAGSEIVFLQHSSGTTGLKKGVMLSHRAVLDFVAALGTSLQLAEDDVVASWLPLYHDMGLIGCLVLPMICGLTTVHLNPFDWVLRPSLILDVVERYRATLCWMPNFAFHHIMRTTPDESRWDLSTMRAFIDCSEPCKPETLRQFRKRFANCRLALHALQVSYGMAENVFIATQTDVQSDPRTLTADMQAYSASGRITDPVPGQPAIEFVSVGPPIPGTSLRILDEAGEKLPDRRVGQISIVSPYLFSGYFGMPTPDEKFRDGWYMTGDLGFTDAGEVFVCGRIDDLLIINGRNIYAHDVEYAINRYTSVKPGRCVAIGLYNRRSGSQSLIVIAETEETDAAPRQVLVRAAQTVIETEFGIAAYDIHVADPGWLIKTTSGKISREANAKKYAAEKPMP